MPQRNPISLRDKIAIAGVTVTLLGTILNFVGPLSGWFVVLGSAKSLQNHNSSDAKREYEVPDLDRYYNSEKIWLTNDEMSAGKPRHDSTALQKLRTSNSLNAVSELLDEKKMKSAPKSSYFFIDGSYLGYLDQSSTLNAFNLERISYQDTPYSNFFEVHRLSDGGFKLIGWLNPSESARLQSSEPLCNLDLTLSNKPTGPFSILATLPLSKFTQCEIRNISTEGNTRYKLADLKFTK